MHRVWRRTWGTETSKYPEENKETSIPSVAASEIGIAQTVLRDGVVDTNVARQRFLRIVCERRTIEGDSPVVANKVGLGAPE